MVYSQVKRYFLMKNKSPQANGLRESGLDLLRLLAMLMITTLHCVNQITGLSTSKTFLVGHLIANIFEIIFYCGVDCFALISGYLMVNSTLKLSKVIQLWLTCLFFSLGIAVIFALVTPLNEFYSWKVLLKLFFPVSMRMWWYITAYFGLLIFIPLVNRAMTVGPIRQNTLLIVLLFISTSAFSTIMTREFINVMGGYSAIWLLVCYIFGAYIKLYRNKIIEFLPWRKGVLIYSILLFCYISFFIGTSLLAFYGVKQPYHWLTSVLFNYVNIPTFLSSLLLLIIFMQIKIRNEKLCLILTTLSGSALGVYLLHEHFLIRNLLVSKRNVWFQHDYNIVWKIVMLIFCLYILGILSDLIRIKIFKILKIKYFCSKLDILSARPACQKK